jgi:protein-tyrosine phosphatase
LLLNCTGTELYLPKHKIPFERGKKYEISENQEIILDWYNYKAPSISPGFWGELFNHIKTSETSLLVFCEGGHGRTGTALAALLIANGFTAREAVEYIRKEYCPKAVETRVQETYLLEVEKYYKGEK